MVIFQIKRISDSSFASCFLLPQIRKTKNQRFNIYLFLIEVLKKDTNFLLTKDILPILYNLQFTINMSGKFFYLISWFEKLKLKFTSLQISKKEDGIKIKLI